MIVYVSTFVLSMRSISPNLNICILGYIKLSIAWYTVSIYNSWYGMKYFNVDGMGLLSDT